MTGPWPAISLAPVVTGIGDQPIRPGHFDGTWGVKAGTWTILGQVLFWGSFFFKSAI